MGPGVRYMFHSTVFTSDYRATRDALVRLVGLRELEFSENLDPAIGRAGGMSWLGDSGLEIGEPLIPGGPQWRWVEKFGGGNHSVAVQVEDMQAAVGHLRDRDLRVHQASTGDPYHVMFTNPRDFGGVLVEWFEGSPEFDPRWGGTVPEEEVPPLVPVVRQAWVGAVVDDPERIADRLADACGTAVTFEHPDAPLGEPRAGVALGDCTLALYRRPTDDDESRRLWGRVHRHPRVSLLTLLVSDLEEAEAGLETAGVRSAARRDRLIICETGPATGGVELAFTDRLLPGDPRGVA